MSDLDPLTLNVSVREVTNELLRRYFEAVGDAEEQRLAGPRLDVPELQAMSFPDLLAFRDNLIRGRDRLEGRG